MILWLLHTLNPACFHAHTISTPSLYSLPAVLIILSEAALGSSYQGLDAAGRAVRRWAFPMDLQLFLVRTQLEPRAAERKNRNQHIYCFNPSPLREKNKLSCLWFEVTFGQRLTGCEGGDQWVENMILWRYEGPEKDILQVPQQNYTE